MSQRHVPPELASPFLEAKVQLPSLADATVRRPRLLEHLDSGIDCELTVISGPAGAGKTSLLIDWLSADGERPAAWLSLDEYDNDPMQFWSGVVAALVAVPGSALGPHIARLLGLARSDGRLFLDALGEALGEEKHRPTLVLDDFHTITNEDIHSAIGLMIRYLAPRLRLVLATRTTPPLSLGRLRAGGRLCEVRFDDLRFTDVESEELLGRMGGDTTRSDVRKLVAATEGWAAALYVAAIGRQRAGVDGRRAIGDQARRHLSEYLVEEVLANEPEERRRFLLETSILDPLTAARCDAVTGRTDSARILHELEQSSQFLRRHDDEGRWFRCHALLRDLLKIELELRSLPVAELHRRAAAIAAEEQDIVAAIHHGFEGRDHETTARLIGEEWIDFTNRGRFALVMSWVDRWVADRAAVNDPTIFIVGAWAGLHTGRLDEVEDWLNRAEAAKHEGPLPDGTASLASAVSIVRNSHRRRVGSVGEGVAAAEPAVLAEREPRSPWRAVARVGQGATLYWAGRWDDARSALEDATETARAAGLLVPIVLGQGYLAMLDRRDGDGPRARQRAEGAVSLAVERHLTGYDQAAAAHLALGQCQLDSIELDAAKPNLTTALRLAVQGGERLLIGSAHLALAESAHLQNRQAESDRELSEASHILQQCADPGILADLVATTERRLRGSRTVQPTGSELTPRERTVLRYLGSELTLPAIASELHVSPNTVKTQVASIRSKLGASNRADAVRIGREHGLLP